MIEIFYTPLEETKRQLQLKKQKYIIPFHIDYTQIQRKLFWKVILSPALESNLPKSKAQEQPQVPCNQPQPAHQFHFILAQNKIMGPR